MGGYAIVAPKNHIRLLKERNPFRIVGPPNLEIDLDRLKYIGVYLKYIGQDLTII